MTNKQPSVENTPEKSVEEIKSNFYKKYSSKPYPKQMTAIVNELCNDFEKTLQAERQKREDVVEAERQLTIAEVKSGAVKEWNGDGWLYIVSEDELQALTQPNNPKEDVGFFRDEEKGNMWRNEDGSVEKYNHQDDQFSELCGSQYCRCGQ